MIDFELGGNPLISIKIVYNNCHSTADKYRYLLYIEKELKSKYKEIEDYPGHYQNEQSNYDGIKEWLLTEFEYIEKISKTDIETYSQEREGIIQPDKNKAAEFYKCDWYGIFDWDYDEIVNYANERYETIHEKINFFNQVISYSKLGDEYYKKAALETDEMKKKKELRRLLKLKIKELELQLKYPTDKNGLSEDLEKKESVQFTSTSNLSKDIQTIRNPKHLINCKIPITVLSSAFLKLAEEEDDGVLVSYVDHKDLELQLTMHFSFPDIQFSLNNQIKFRKMKWMKQLTDLTYFIERLSNPNVNIIEVKARKISDLIVTHFCDSAGQDFLPESVSGAKKKYKRNKGAKTNGVRGVPTGYEIIELFIENLTHSG